MKRTKAGGASSGSDFDSARNMSYTNLAAMASEFENSSARTVHPVVASAAAAASSSGSPEAQHAKAMEMIQMGLKLDLNNPAQAAEYYQLGADLLSQALEAGSADARLNDEMQSRLDIVSERVRVLTREIIGRSLGGSESQLTSALPSVATEVDDSLASVAPAEQRACNFFDLAKPGSMPPAMREAAAACAPQFEQLTRHFGFQQESAYNQHEHLAMLIANNASRERDSSTPAGVSTLHAKLLSNYKLWTRQLGIQPQSAGEFGSLEHKITDLVLLLLVWGEAANLKHVPESLCFLFHQMRTELWMHNRVPIAPRQQGWFLSRVIAPLYRTMRAEMNRKARDGKPLGHTRKCNYDDFNEFFWTAECLRFAYFLGDEEDREPLSVGSFKVAGAGGGGLLRETFGAAAQSQTGPPISTMPVRKRYVERRSWLHPIRSFWRIHAFLLCMLHALLCLAFNEKHTGIVLDGALLQSLLGVSVTHAVLGVLRELLGVFTMHGMLHTQPAVFGSLLLRLTLKVGATVVLSATYSSLMAATPLEHVRDMEPAVWWRHVLLANETFCMAAGLYATPAALSLLAQIFPPLSTLVRRQRGPLKAVIDAFEPLNRLFVGKDIHVNMSDKLPFDFFWLSLLALKFCFSYAFQIQPLVAPTMEIWKLDLADWYPSAELGKAPNIIVIVVRWLPLIIMYMIDTQLWFMLWTAAYGTVIGCALHIGEVPDLDSVRESFLVAAENFNRKIVPAAVGLESAREAPYRPPAFVRRAKNGKAGAALDELKGAALDGMRLAELNEAFLQDGDGGGGSGEIRNESLRYFADAWNAVLDDMRASDLLSNHEHSILLFRCWTSANASHFSRCTYLPVFCTAGKLNEAFNTVHTLSVEGELASLKKRQALEAALHADISSDFEMREALTEFLELTHWLLSGLLGERHASSVRAIAAALDALVEGGEALDVIVASHLPKLSSAVVDLAKTVLALKLAPPETDGGPPRLDEKASVSKLIDKLRSTLDTLKAVIGKAPKPLVQDLDAIKFTSLGLFWDDAYARATIAALRAEEQAADKLQGIVSLCTTAALDTMPEEYEVKRRLCWFVGSLFMEMPRSPPVARMHSWTVMTPFYAEDLLYSAKELAAKTEDGVSMLIFLKTVHETEWRNFLERVGVAPGSEGEARLFTEKPLLEELRLWASFRGQTLSRTVEGMMLHERALLLLASWEGLSGRSLSDATNLKFQYVVSAQAYGTHKKNRDLKAADTEFLLQRYPSLRVAYVDKASTLTKVSETDGRASLKEAIRFYSVLIKGVRQKDEAVVQEIFRVQLPGDIMLGEGKPENQNHAMIFTRGEALQTIDMNQCGYFEEALKMRNLLCEFRTHPDAPHAPTILGFREHIFTGTSKQLSSLASYMALQEGCFVTLTQRVLWNPLQVRLHYGHPDVFDKLYSMTRGGVSKASRGINLSEDIYAGFNHLLRGATIPYIEYVQVGKGRDVGMQQIYKFEAKLASGNAEQCLSRDVYRIGQRLDFTRLLSFYFSGPGFYFNNACTVFAMFVFLHLQLWSHILQLDAGVPHADLLNAQWVLQLGLLLTVPILCYLAVEHGIFHSVKKFVETFLTGSPFFFMFHMGTKAHYYDSTLKYGGAKYRPTGRGFVMQHEDFAELYRFHAPSHLYNGFELLWGLLLLLMLGEWPVEGSYWRTTWSLWAVMAAWLFAPFWFNPLAFDPSKLRLDVQSWLMWMRRRDANPLASWEAWYDEEHTYLQTGSWMKRLHILAPGVRYALTFLGLLAALSETTMEEGVLLELEVLGTILGSLGALLLTLALFRFLCRRSPLALRVGSTFLLIAVVIAVPMVLSYVSLFQIVLLVAAVGYGVAAAIRVPFMFGKPRFVLCRLAMQAYDYLCGGLLLGLCMLCSAAVCCRALQTKSLLSQVFERRVAHNEIMRLLQTTE